MTKIVVIGSTNVDRTLRVPRFAKPGETMITSDPERVTGGGKGANQAIAAARMGASTTFISKVGTEADAQMMLETFAEARIDTTFVSQTTAAETGKAYITVNAEGQNSIFVYGGANNLLSPADADLAEKAIAEADFVIAQLEIANETIEEAFELAKKHGTKTVLNQAPAKTLPQKLLELTDVIVPNETETELLTGFPADTEANLQNNVDVYLALGIQTVLITEGSAGSFWANASGSGFVPAYKVDAVDTTAAGDTFIGALFSQLDSDLTNLPEAMLFSNKASSLTVQKFGAQDAIPLLAEVEAAK